MNQLKSINIIQIANITQSNCYLKTIITCSNKAAIKISNQKLQ